MTTKQFSTTQMNERYIGDVRGFQTQDGTLWIAANTFPHEVKGCWHDRETGVVTAVYKDVAGYGVYTPARPADLRHVLNGSDLHANPFREKFREYMKEFESRAKKVIADAFDEIRVEIEARGNG